MTACTSVVSVYSTVSDTQFITSTVQMMDMKGPHVIRILPITNCNGSCNTNNINDYINEYQRYIPYGE